MVGKSCMEKVTSRRDWTAKFTPDYMAVSVRDIDFKVLRARGIRCVAFDVDSTLVGYGGVALDSETLLFLQQLQKQGFIQKIYLATNRHQRNLEPLAREIGAGLLQAKGWRRKPGRQYFRKLLKALDCPPRQTVMIGDKLVTDVYGGRRAGMVTILVERLGPDSRLESWLPFRAFESWIIKRFTKTSAA